MSSRSVNIPDMWAAVGPGRAAGGPMAGEFAADGKSYAFPDVASQDARGTKRFWAVRVAVRGPAGGDVVFNTAEFLSQPVAALAGYVGEITTATWHEGGPKHAGKTPTVVPAGRNLGKKNATNPATQALRDALSLYNKHTKSSSSAAPLAFVPGARPFPMLVQKVGGTASARLTMELFEAGTTVQPKINGVRVVAFQPPGKTAPPVLYSRTGGDYQGMEALRGEVGRMLGHADAAWKELCAHAGHNPWNILVEKGLATRSAPAPYLDGELYSHGKDLRFIAGEGRRESGGEGLQYWVFDCFFPELKAAGLLVKSTTRRDYLDILFRLAAGAGKIVRVPNTELAASPNLDGYTRQLDALAQGFVEREGYEGAILRKNKEGYQYGTNGFHSSNLIKIKPIYDSEFPVTGYTQGSKGKDVGAVLWVCKVPAAQSKTGVDEPFTVSPKNLTYPERYRIYAALGAATEGGKTRFERDFEGKMLTVEYPELSSKTGIPTQAKALAFRPSDDATAGEDPVSRLLRECP
jgi:hypothetical protein